MSLKFSQEPLAAQASCLLVPSHFDTDLLPLSNDEKAWLGQQIMLKKDWVAIPRLPEWIIIAFSGHKETAAARLEHRRRQGNTVLGFLNSHGFKNLQLSALETETDELMAFAEGMALGNYQFLKYRSDAGEKKNSMAEILIQDSRLTKDQLDAFAMEIDTLFWARNLVNEPLNYLNAEMLAEQISLKAESAGVKTEVLTKKKIEALKMGGLLAVNWGSVDPPTFTILEWKPENAVNTKPVVLIGKGVVYDTGGMSLKPSGSMETMKCDMAGSAAVSAIIAAAASQKLALHLVALVPATDNRVDGNAFVPGDVITISDGTTVEVLNTDAEGRLLLADALTYAKKFDPELVITYATLTGAATRAIGSQGIVAMETKAEKEFALLIESGYHVHERIAAFPMWDEYKDQLKSEIADLKNIGGAEAGMITAGKFLEHFTAYPFIHLDIAATAFLEKRDSYRGLGGTGSGIRLTLDFLKKLASKK